MTTTIPPVEPMAASTGLTSDSDLPLQPPNSTRSERNARWALGATTVCVVAAGAWTLVPMWLPLTLAAWFADLVAPLHKKLARWMGGKARGASLVSVLLVVAALSPFALIALSLTSDVIELAGKITSSQDLRETAQSLFGQADAASGPWELKSNLTFDARSIMQLIEKHGAGALGALGTVLGITASVVVGLVVFVATFYALLVSGENFTRWIERHSPLSTHATRRFGAVFTQTGRGLLVGIGLTALAQGATATIGYVIVKVPHAMVLGLLTAIASLVPSVGSGIVWLPVATAMFVVGRSGAGIAILAVGFVVSCVDNVMRPLFAKAGDLDMSALLVFLSMLGGIAAFGAGGLLLGPLAVRLAMEALSLWSARPRLLLTARS